MIEMMALHPRAVMNSWKPDVAPDWQAATTPWLYPDILPAVRAALDLRTTFLPLMYTLAYRAHRDGSPIIRPLFHDFPDDPLAYDDQDAMMLGPDVLFSPVVSEGATRKAQYLPKGPMGWVEYHTGKVHRAGTTVRVAAPLGQPPVFVRGGAALVLASATPHVKPHDAPARRLYLAAVGASGTGQGTHFEDDGESWGFRDGQCLDLAITWTWGKAGAAAEIRRNAGDAPLPDVSAWAVEYAGGKQGAAKLRLLSQ